MDFVKYPIARTDDEKVVDERFVREGKELFELACRIRDFTRSYWEGNRDSMARADEWMKYWKNPSVERLSGLADLSESLARLAEKQLAGEAWSEADKKVVTGYGTKLGKLMYYEGNSYLSPKDDAPKIVSYSTLGGGGRPGFFTPQSADQGYCSSDIPIRPAGRFFARGPSIRSGRSKQKRHHMLVNGGMKRARKPGRNGPSRWLLLRWNTSPNRHNDPHRRDPAEVQRAAPACNFNPNA